jgi:hypothetical protein
MQEGRQMAGYGAVRASHQEREATVQVLRDAYAAGRLDLEELRTRAGAAYQARTWDELRALLADLPTWQAFSRRYGPPAEGPHQPGPRARPRPGSSRRPVLMLVIMMVLLGIGASAWWPVTLLLVIMLPALAAAVPGDRPASRRWRR